MTIIPSTSSVEDEKQLLRKLDTTILPWIMLMYSLSYMDRSNIGNARNIGLSKDLHLTDTQYSIASSSFYIGTFCFGTIGGLMLKVIKPYTWLAVCMIGWGAISTFQALCTDGPSLAGVRFLLGVFEASFAPGCALYSSFWYLKSGLSLRIAAYAGTSALSGVAGGLIAYGFGSASALKIAAWKSVFIIEGLPTVLPEVGKSHWFTDEEQKILLHRRTRFTQNLDNEIDLAQMKSAFLDYRLYLFVLIYSGLSLSLAVISIFLLTIVGDLGYKAIYANLMTVPVYATAYGCLLTTAWASDRTRMRGIPIMIGGALSGIGYILLGILTSDKARFASTFLVVTGTYIAFPIVLAWIMSAFAADTKSGVGVGVVIAVTHAVGVAASNIFPKHQAPRYLIGYIISGSLCFFAAVAALLMILLLKLENHRRDRIYGKPEKAQVIQMTGLADKAINFRYIL
ncbi:major facilitator superfamily domain-containing protein [Tricladium varicosporioides]|nr:major facilitator superfamily domain-containing protein [Hymenoscyphus varicosporioides]